jgi:hypothetical protein
LHTTTKHGESATADAGLLNLMLNIQYLQAQFFAYATTGDDLCEVAEYKPQPSGSLFHGAGACPALLAGTGMRGSVTGGRAASFTSVTVEQYAREIANDDLSHLRLLRSALGAWRLGDSTTGH